MLHCAVGAGEIDYIEPSLAPGRDGGTGGWVCWVGQILEAVEWLPVPAGVELVPDAVPFGQTKQVDTRVGPGDGGEAVCAVPRGGSNSLRGGGLLVVGCRGGVGLLVAYRRGEKIGGGGVLDSHGCVCP